MGGKQKRKLPAESAAACDARQTIGYSVGLPQVGSSGHPSDPTRPEPAHGSQNAWNPSNPYFQGPGRPSHGPGAYVGPQGPAAAHPQPTHHAAPGQPQTSAPAASYQPGAYPQQPAQPVWGQAPPPAFSSGDAGGSNYVPPPPPPPVGAQHHQGGFGEEKNSKKLWRNGLLALLGIAVFLWLVAWVLPPRMVAFVPTTFDVEIGEQSWEEVAPAASHCTDPGPLAYVEELAQPLVDQAHSEFDFHFVVVDSEEINAFALPGGFVTVNMGLLEAAENGEEIAAVLAHEMTHVTNRHGMRAVLRRVGAVSVVSLVFGGTGLETVAYAAEGLAGQAHSRSQERDADEGGRELLMSAGVDPIGMATFFERLEEEYEALPEGMRRGFTLLSTHPDPGERAQTTREIAAGFEVTRDLPDPPPGLRCHASDEPVGDE